MEEVKKDKKVYKASKLLMITFLALISFQSSANIIKISVEFEASEFTDLYGSNPFPSPSISGITSFFIDTASDPSGVFMGELTPASLGLEIDGKVWMPLETMISYIFQGNVLTHFTIGGIIAPGDSLFNTFGTNNDFVIDRQGNVQGSATVALQSLETIFSSQNLSLNVKVAQVPAPPAIFLMLIGMLVLLKPNKRKL